MSEITAVIFYLQSQAAAIYRPGDGPHGVGNSCAFFFMAWLVVSQYFLFVYLFIVVVFRGVVQ